MSGKPTFQNVTGVNASPFVSVTRRASEMQPCKRNVRQACADWKCVRWSEQMTQRQRISRVRNKFRLNNWHQTQAFCSELGRNLGLIGPHFSRELPPLAAWSRLRHFRGATSSRQDGPSRDYSIIRSPKNNQGFWFVGIGNVKSQFQASWRDP